MRKPCRRTGALLLVLVALPIGAAAQTAVEAGLAAGRSATMAAPARSAGKSMAGAWGSLDGTLKAGQSNADSGKTSSSPASPTGPAAKDAKKPPAPAPVYEDPNKIQAGLAYEELLKRFGPPSMEITVESGKKSLGYTAKDGSIQLEVEGGKVTSVDKTKPQQSSVIVIQ